MICQSDVHLEMKRLSAHFITLDMFEKLGLTALHVILQVTAQASHWQPDTPLGLRGILKLPVSMLSSN